MSSLTLCNYCSMQRIRRQTPDTHRLVMSKNDWGLGGTTVYRVPKDIEIPKPIVRDSEFHKEYFVSWLMEIPKRCCC